MKSAFLILAAAIPLAAQVSYDRIRQADAEPGNWLTDSGGYNAQRYSRLDQINATNVRRLHAAWVYQIKATDAFETRAARRGRHYVFERAGWQRDGARHSDWAAHVEIHAYLARQRSRLLRTGESRGGHSRRDGLCRYIRCPSDRARYQVWNRAVGFGGR